MYIYIYIYIYVYIYIYIYIYIYNIMCKYINCLQNIYYSNSKRLDENANVCLNI